MGLVPIASRAATTTNTLIGGNDSLVADTISADEIDGDAGDDLILGDSGTAVPLNVTSPCGVGGDTIRGGAGEDTSMPWSAMFLWVEVTTTTL